MDKPLRLAYFGSGRFAVPPLEALLAQPGNFQVSAVVCQPDRPVGRGRRLESCPVGQMKLPDPVPLWQPKAIRGNRDFIDRVRGLDLDLALVASYGQILPAVLLKSTRLGFLNLHGSLLPRWRGASPIQSAILAGDRTTGVTLMVMDEKMDHGPTLSQRELTVAPDETRTSLEDRLAGLAADMTEDILAFAEGRLTPRPQDHAQATFCKILTRQDGQVDWPNETAAQIERKLRAFTPWPGLYTIWHRADGSAIRLKLLALRLPADRVNEIAPGTVSRLENGNLAITAADQRLVEVTIAQVEGRQPCQGRAVACGYQDLVGAVLSSREA